MLFIHGSIQIGDMCELGKSIEYIGGRLWATQLNEFYQISTFYYSEVVIREDSAKSNLSNVLSKSVGLFRSVTIKIHHCQPNVCINNSFCLTIQINDRENVIVSPWWIMYYRVKPCIYVPCIAFIHSCQFLDYAVSSNIAKTCNIVLKEYNSSTSVQYFLNCYHKFF